MIDLNALKNVTWDIYHKRKKKGAKINEPLRHCAIEVIEAAEARAMYEEAYLKKSLNEGENAGEKELNNLALQLADIIICVLNCAAEYEINIEKAIRDNIEKTNRVPK